MEKQISKRAQEEKSIQKKVIKTIEKYNLIAKGDTIVMGVSGGPDSMALLDLLSKMPDISILVAHINHGIREEAKEDSNYVEQYCKDHHIPFFYREVKIEQIAKQQKIGTEEAGRNIRYAFFKEVAEKTQANKIATAHNANDNAETVLMNIMRGSGLSGLKGIEPKRENYIRPLIECTREEIEAYCQEQQLQPRLDKTNFENTYTRNKIRNILIPLIKKEFNPNIIPSLNRLSHICQSENQYIETISKQQYQAIKIEENKNQIILALPLFNQQETVIRNRIVRYSIQKLLGNSQGIEKTNIEDIITLCQKNIGNKEIMPNKNIKVKIKNKKIFFEKVKGDEVNLP